MTQSNEDMCTDPKFETSARSDIEKRIYFIPSLRKYDIVILRKVQYVLTILIVPRFLAKANVPQEPGSHSVPGLRTSFLDKVSKCN